MPGNLVDRVLYRDGLVLIIDKPAGIPVHGGPGGGTNLEQQFGSLRFGLKRSPALAHRLDRDTSGCLVLGRHPKALRRLGRLFAEAQVEKVYWAIVAGVPAKPQGRIEAALRKVTRGAGWHMAIDPAGSHAVTDYRMLGAADGRAWLELRPHTGRTHQIRVHCAALGCPVIGDPAYGDPAYGDPAYGGPARGGLTGMPLHLHARSIALPLYAERSVTAVAPVPPHMLAALARLGYDPATEHVRAATGAAEETMPA
ncbi:MAG TPA: RNA pseudouridine synthase [Stellaceae bacterium]|jgi:tRNA pseudouridine32 synthase/23S rRNA pseudouridine746 synthase/23S rRNA pseudouridine1911/1915/1917 synthase|nr:RNA pseudouridine synthase [Stellaceae bacterium]